MDNAGEMDQVDTWSRLRIARWPASLRVLMTLFIVIIGTGYLMAMGNMYHRHRLADGVDGLSLDDLRAVFSGLQKPIQDSDSSTADNLQPESGMANPSRMWEIVQPGEDMYEHLVKGGDEAIRSLNHWLRSGAAKEMFEQSGLVQPGDPSPQHVISRNCLRCHNAEDGEKQDTPYGADIFTVDYQMVYEYAAPGTGETSKQAESEESGTGAPRTERIRPQAASHLYLVSHIHMLSIPVFSLILALLTMLTDLPGKVRGFIAVVPMAASAVDFACWWAARWSQGFVFLMVAAGFVFGLTFGLQILIVIYHLWFKHQRTGAA
jgi:hypothetical protein